LYLPSKKNVILRSARGDAAARLEGRKLLMQAAVLDLRAAALLHHAGSAHINSRPRRKFREEIPS